MTLLTLLITEFLTPIVPVIHSSSLSATSRSCDSSAQNPLLVFHLTVKVITVAHRFEPVTSQFLASISSCLLQWHWPPYYSYNTPTMLLPQGLSIDCCLCLNCSFLRCPHGSSIKPIKSRSKRTFLRRSSKNLSYTWALLPDIPIAHFCFIYFHNSSYLHFI